MHKPTLCVIAGPNGSGKTTTTEQLLANEWGADSVYINPDNIAKEEFGDWNDADAVLKASEAGFFIRLFFVCTESPEINVARIAKRYMNGGHEVPISKVVSRYFKSLELAKEAIKFVDRAYIYDNSKEDHLPELIYRTASGSLAKQYTENSPHWAKILVPELPAQGNTV